MGKRQRWLHSVALSGRIGCIQPSPFGVLIRLPSRRCLMTRTNAFWQGCAAFDQSSLPICQCAFDQLERKLVELSLTNDRSGYVSVRLTNSRRTDPALGRQQVRLPARLCPAIARAWPQSVTDERGVIGSSTRGSASLSRDVAVQLCSDRASNSPNLQPLYRREPLNADQYQRAS
jgi:hypothetical protein